MFDDTHHPHLDPHLKHYLDAREQRSYASRMRKSTIDEAIQEGYAQQVAYEDGQMKMHKEHIPAGALTSELNDLAYEQGFARAGKALGMDPNLISRGGQRTNSGRAGHG